MIWFGFFVLGLLVGWLFFGIGFFLCSFCLFGVFLQQHNSFPANPSAIEDYWFLGSEYSDSSLYQKCSSQSYTNSSDSHSPTRQLLTTSEKRFRPRPNPDKSQEPALAGRYKAHCCLLATRKTYLPGYTISQVLGTILASISTGYSGGRHGQLNWSNEKWPGSHNHPKQY